MLLGLEDELGSLDTGKRADLILISRHAPEFNPLIDVANALVYGSDGRNVDTVIVGGKVIMQAKEVLTLDAEKLYAEVAKASPKLIERAGLKPAAAVAYSLVSFAVPSHSTGRRFGPSCAHQLSF